MGSGDDGNQAGDELIPQTPGNEPEDPESRAAAAASSDQPMALDCDEAGPGSQDTRVVALPKRSSPRTRRQTRNVNDRGCDYEMAVDGQGESRRKLNCPERRLAVKRPREHAGDEADVDETTGSSEQGSPVF